MKFSFEKVKAAILEHRWMIIGALSLTVLIFLPLLIFPGVIGKDYQGINIGHFGTDAHFYLSRGKEVLEGHSLGSPLLREGKNETDQFFSDSEYLLLSPIKFLGLSSKVDVVTVYHVFNFIGVFLLIILIYLFTWRLSGNKLLAAAAALFVVGGYSIIYYKTLFYSDFNIYGRPMNPYFSSLVFFGYLNLLVRSLGSADYKDRIYSGVVFGLLFYVYFFSWSFALCLNAVLFLIFILKKDRESLKKIFFITAIGLLMGSVNLINLFSSLNSAMGKQVAYFHWMSYGHAPIFSKIGFLILLLLAIFFLQQRNDKNLPLVLAMTLSGWLALNQQVLTGRMLQYGHYYWYYIVPLSIIVSLYLIGKLLADKKIVKVFWLLLIALAFINTIGGQFRSFFTTWEFKKYEQNFRPIIDALNQEKKPGVILSGDEANEYLFTIYTPHDLFWHIAVSFGPTPIQRFKDALFVYLYLNKEARNDFSKYLASVSDDRAGWSLYQELFRNLEGYWSGLSYYEYNYKISIQDKALDEKRPIIIKELTDEYDRVILKGAGINSLLRQYGVNFLVWDKNKNPEWDLSGLAGLKLLTSYNNIFLYELD